LAWTSAAQASANWASRASLDRASSTALARPESPERIMAQIEGEAEAFPDRGADARADVRADRRRLRSNQIGRSSPVADIAAKIGLCARSTVSATTVCCPGGSGASRRMQQAPSPSRQANAAAPCSPAGGKLQRSAQNGNRNGAREWVVADAVAVEPVSSAEFPADREICREFRRIGLLGVILTADTTAISEACRQIPYLMEQGI